MIQQTQQRPKGWWGRNWKWGLPLGCFGGSIVFIGFILVLVMFVFNVMRMSFVYQESLKRAREHPAVIDALGTPIDDDFWLAGNLETNDSSGNARLTIPISGPHGKARVYVIATKSMGEWEFNTLYVVLKPSGERIDLLEDS